MQDKELTKWIIILFIGAILMTVYQVQRKKDNHVQMPDGYYDYDCVDRYSTC